MAEIDFDELDKAVNSIMSGSNVPKKDDDTTHDDADMTQKDDHNDDSAHDTVTEDSHADHTVETREDEQGSQPETSADADDAESNSIRSYVSEADNTDSDTEETYGSEFDDASEDTSEEQEDSAPVQSTPLATKRRGQFMDMKHPSADMKTNASTNTSAIPSRQGVTLAPLTTSMTTPPDSVPEPTDSPMTAESVDVSHLDGVDTTLPEQSSQPEEEATDQTAEDDTAPTSPFLPDAKVEKRPLGAPLDLTDTNDENTLMEDEQLATENAAPESSESQATLPQELHSSVLEVEADTTAEAAAPGQSVSKTEEQGTDMTTGEVSDSDTSLASPAATPEPSERGMAGPTSIAPQYKTHKAEVETTDEPQGSLYDSAVEHPALAEHKKPSHWLVAIIVVIMLLLGAAGGAVLYLYQTGAL